MRSKPFLLWAPAMLALAACPTRDISKLDPSPASELKRDIEVSANRDVDILFVIDNSDSMQEEQTSLAANFPRFIDVLRTIPGGLPNVHIGVVSSDVGIYPYTGDKCSGHGDNGLLQNKPRGSCAVPNGGARYIEDIALPAGGRSQNYPQGANLTDVFSCIAKLGTSGCGFEHHLESMKRALDGSNPENAGFLRDGAYLAVIVLADEDDCSDQKPEVFNTDPALDNISSMWGVNASYRCTEFGVQCNGSPLPRAAADYDPTMCGPRTDSGAMLWTPQHYFDFLRGVKGEPNLLIGAVIAGNVNNFGVEMVEQPGGGLAPQLKHSCHSANGVADPAIRLANFASLFGDQGRFVSICNPDLSDALTTIAQLLALKVGTPCLTGPVDTTDINPAEPGTQIDCQVSDVRFPGQEGSTETVVPRCAMRDDHTPVTDVLPCWWTSIDSTICPAVLSETHTVLHVERSAAGAPIGTHEVAKCVLKE
jgi:hypothetical protein